MKQGTKGPWDKGTKESPEDRDKGTEEADPLFLKRPHQCVKHAADIGAKCSRLPA